MQFRLLEVIKRHSSPTLFKSHPAPTETVNTVHTEQAIADMLHAIIDQNYADSEHALAELKNSDNLAMAKRFFKDLVGAAHIRIWTSQSSRDDSALVSALDDPAVFKNARLSEYHFKNFVCRHVDINEFNNYLKVNTQLAEALKAKLAAKATAPTQQATETVVPFIRKIGG